jgi:hypothetical protein
MTHQIQALSFAHAFCQFIQNQKQQRKQYERERAMAAVLANTKLGQQHALLESAKEDTVSRLKSNLNRYTRTNDRRMVLRSLKDVKFLSNITLGNPILPPNVSLSELEQELVEETLILNQQLFKPLSTVTRRDMFTNAGLNSGCLVILKGLSEGLCDDNTSSTFYRHPLNGKALYEKLVARLARTSASADINEYLHALLGTSDLIVKHVVNGQNKLSATPGNAISKSSSHGSSGSDNTNNDKIIRVNVYQSNGDIHMTLDMMLEFGLYRRIDVNTVRPWITLQAYLHERANLSTGKNYRTVRVKTPSLY